VKFWI